MDTHSPQECPPLIKCPDNPEYLTLLGQKREEYQRRIGIHKWLAPEQLPLQDAMLKHFIANAVLTTGQVDTTSLREKVRADLGSAFNDQVFDNACRVIDEYCRTGGVGNIKRFVPQF